MKSILFSTDMVKAILEDRKSQTRRIINPQPEGRLMYCYAGSDRRDHNKWLHGGKRYTPPCHGDDVLWVRETWFEYKGKYFYRADDFHENLDALFGGNSFFKWKPSIHMPREAARLFLRVKSVRVERLQDMSEEDAIAEGFSAGYTSCGDGKFEDVLEHELTARDGFSYLWNTIYAKRGYGWDVNPWLWVVEFERVAP